MPVVDVTVVKADGVVGVGKKDKLCVHVRLQGQTMRTQKVAAAGNVFSFNERFRLQYNPNSQRAGEKNQLCVDVWSKSLFSEKCVSIAWLDMDGQPFEAGRPITFSIRGAFEDRGATVTVMLVPDFTLIPQQRTQTPPSQSQSSQPPYTGNNRLPPPNYPVDLYNGPAVGVVLPPEQTPYSTADYTTADYMPPPLFGSANPRNPPSKSS